MNMLPRPLIVAAVGIACCLSSCAIPSFKELKPRTDSPVKPPMPPKSAAAKNDPAPHVSFALRGFAFNGVWGGKLGYRSTVPYRAKITLWGAGPDEIAELYFYDKCVPGNPDSTQPNYQDETNKLRPYYVLNFPLTTLGPILEQLRNTPAKLTLNYYDGEWAIVATAGESVMIPEPPSKTLRR